jgi:hypothetical protein
MTADRPGITRAGPPSEDEDPAGAFSIAIEAMVTEDQFDVILAQVESLPCA